MTNIRISEYITSSHRWIDELMKTQITGAIRVFAYRFIDMITYSFHATTPGAPYPVPLLFQGHDIPAVVNFLDGSSLLFVGLP
jgi:hypothetical protein